MGSSPSPRPFVTRVQLKNYRSIEACDVELGALAFLVGANGSGKSNFLDALRLIRDALNSSLELALRARGGLGEVRRRSVGHPRNLGIRIDFQLEEHGTGHLAFEIAARKDGEYVVARETCRLGPAFYVVKEGEVTSTTMSVRPPAMNDRLYLPNAAGITEFRPVYDALLNLGFYCINPEVVRELQQPDKGDVLTRDGRNLAAVIDRLRRTKADAALDRIQAYLEKVVPGVTGFHSKRIASMETVEFLQSVQGVSDPWRFLAGNMSDGTLRVLAILVALFQDGGKSRTRLVGLEEPETALHPAAAGLLRDCIVEASAHTQVIVTSHSADLLDNQELPPDSIFAVEAHLGKSTITRIGEATRSILRDRLFTAGELLRSGQLEQDPSQIPEPEQLHLFRDVP
ncbi:MAG: AAA family ATPase [Kofleriaceae bacterium]